MITKVNLKCYVSVRDLYDLIMQKEALVEDRSGSHQLVRKSNRTPSLRLRFGRRSDPSFVMPVNILHLRTRNNHAKQD